MEFSSFINAYQKVVAQYPHNTAVEKGGESYTHLELWQQAAGIAQNLSDLPKGARVALNISKSCTLIASMLGCWMRGLIFVPIDPNLPVQRRTEYIDDVQPHRILHTDTDVQSCQLSKEAVIDTLIRPLSQSDGAYIIYSSGSTGHPKGILIPHRGIMTMLSQQLSTLALTEKDRCLWFLSMQFDASISDIGVSLLSGATIIIDAQESFLKTLHQHRITYVDMPPVFLGIYTPEQFPSSLRSILIGGEPCSYTSLEQHRQHRHIVVVYGPTESTICTSLVVCDAQHLCIENSIGTPLKGVEYHIEQGELWIAGELLAVGYWNRPALDNKWIMRNQKRFFRTGDAVRIHEGEYQFIGRIDRQFKLHGKLIAPEEIEQVLCKQKEVQRAYVCLHQHQLFAFIESTSSTTYSALIKPLHELLPHWMIPQHGIVLNLLPTLPSGKIDRATLRKSIPELHATHLWSSLFSQVLHKPVQMHDNFFEHGGDSIALMALLVLAHKQNQQITPEQLRTHPTPHLLAKLKQQHAGRTVAELKGYVDKECALLSSHVPSSKQTIYITGATGFLGAKILSILCNKGFRPRILVRGKNKQHATERIPEPYRKQVDIFVGDITNRESIEQFIDKGEGLLFHCAASLSLGSSLEDLYTVNVRACTELFSYPKLHIAYASTLAFLLTNDEKKGRLMEEPSTLGINTRIFGGYAQSKWIAEQIALHRKAIIFRFGLLVDDKHLPRFDWFVSFIRGIAKLGFIPQGVQHSVFLDMTPLSYAAEAFVDIALHSTYGIYHVASSKSVSLHQLCLALDSLGYPIKECKKDDWFARIDRMESNHELHVVRLSFHAILYKTTATPQLNMFLATGAYFDDSKTQQEIGKGAPSSTMSSIRAVLQCIMEKV